MKDSFGRTIDYVRISLTDRCNLRCVYCMPESGVESIPHEEILRYEEILRLVRILAPEGVSKIKLTGGEPLVRKDVAYLIRELKKIDGITNVTITTNALLLGDQMDELYKAGLDAVNISMDAVDDVIYKNMTRSHGVETVINTIDQCLGYPNLKVKINCVPIKGENEGQLTPLVELARERNLSVRFIELMPMGFGRQMTCLGEEEIKEIITSTVGRLTEVTEVLGNGPCRYYKADDFAGTIGFISAVSHKFCDSCNRVRLTADGYLKTCLQYDHGVSLKELLRDGSSDGSILEAINKAMDQKPKQHQFDNAEAVAHTEQLTMSRIGG